MNKQQFINYIKSPQNLDADSVSTLENLVKEYPYCQTAESLYTLNLFKEDNFKYNSQLRKATAYVPDRKRLKQHLQSIKPSLNKPSSKTSNQAIKKNAELVEEPKAVEQINITDLLSSLKMEVDSILKEQNRQKNQLPNSTIDELKQKLEKIINHKKSLASELKPDVKDYNFEHLEKEPSGPNNFRRNKDLIDKFIMEEPKINKPPKSEFFSPSGFAQHSLEDKEDVVSETLAKIYLQQGNLTKAIHAYKKLCLVYPEKSSFFAAQIEKIRKDQIN